MTTHPSFGSSMPLSVMYSSYSKRPLNSGRSLWKRNLARRNCTYVLIKGP